MTSTYPFWEKELKALSSLVDEVFNWISFPRIVVTRLSDLYHWNSISRETLCRRIRVASKGSHLLYDHLQRAFNTPRHTCGTLAIHDSRRKWNCFT